MLQHWDSRNVDFLCFPVINLFGIHKILCRSNCHEAVCILSASVPDVAIHTEMDAIFGRSEIHMDLNYT